MIGHFSVIIGLKILMCSVCVRFSFILEVICVILVSMPCFIWVNNIISPTHTNTVLSCSINWWESLLHIITLGIKWISRTRAPLHQWTLVSWSLFEINGPIFSSSFINWVFMDVFNLWHVNSCNFILKHAEWFVWIGWYGGTSTTRDTLEWSLKYPNFVWVNFHC